MGMNKLEKDLEGEDVGTKRGQSTLCGTGEERHVKPVDRFCVLCSFMRNLVRGDTDQWARNRWRQYAHGPASADRTSIETAKPLNLQTSILIPPMKSYITSFRAVMQ